MKIFRVADLRISPIIVVADDVHHASHTFLRALWDGLGHWPETEYSIGPWLPPEDQAPEILTKMADDSTTSALANFCDNGWELLNRSRADL